MESTRSFSRTQGYSRDGHSHDGHSHDGRLSPPLSLPSLPSTASLASLSSSEPSEAGPEKERSSSMKVASGLPRNITPPQSSPVTSSQLRHHSSNFTPRSYSPSPVSPAAISPASTSLWYPNNSEVSRHSSSNTIVASTPELRRHSINTWRAGVSTSQPLKIPTRRSSMLASTYPITAASRSSMANSSATMRDSIHTSSSPTPRGAIPTDPSYPLRRSIPTASSLTPRGSRSADPSRTLRPAVPSPTPHRQIPTRSPTSRRLPTTTSRRMEGGSREAHRDVSRRYHRHTIHSPQMARTNRSLGDNSRPASATAVNRLSVPEPLSKLQNDSRRLDMGSFPDVRHTLERYNFTRATGTATQLNQRTHRLSASIGSSPSLSSVVAAQTSTIEAQATVIALQRGQILELERDAKTMALGFQQRTFDLEDMQSERNYWRHMAEMWHDRCEALCTRHGI
ncbi:uncharacterized protein CcaverHIS019_0211730 [Cutaneotrichosporon cavernicola]|uniref:Uncharacterized protein n=1 Tax=Cutaneotrichosporon cavernicola TaxID=279322 RepID=A0AA48L0F2_9TREE|nr:uncharacterized protein CcaverHIS019_0211730 [Cutaneotrichosporon cavernicola]BEI89811.1 hypothetical protein CcaverHIS019_0211730 [Cutaneotrichosporon cavernicola]BEI97581.1 hypothetical protein CcaverHIS631_0211700 [Cutaneotrichosporon cavernicola]BEJ05361.1 hypothetical protein CcaverHIS641_0211780 [Cutaneotrichosporon cavernicola]